MPKKKKLLRLREAAEMLGVNPETLRRWDIDGKLKAVRIGTRPNRKGERVGDRRYHLEDITKLMKK
ncbi:hypothetical protein A2862_03335 [Candidatus Roizmanbacteria bacterium RIFCSPHIGHO2_01_FULL_38_41]|nr:MAG: hypothetical protein A2862_03335 [Candidatus Roizmanbacteria bacterium RIFCSPHIGHO2_01_FULL_38_41]